MSRFLVGNMSGRGKSPLKAKWGGVKGAAAENSSDVDREAASGQMQDIFSTVKKLRVSHTRLCSLS